MIKTKMPKAVNQGEIKLGALRIGAAVLDNDERDRVVSIRSFSTFLGVKGGGAYWKQKKLNPKSAMLPEFVSAGYLQEYIGDEIKELLLNTIEYKTKVGGKAQGLKCIIIPKICDIWIKALHGGKLDEKQREIAKKAHILLSALAEVGITALIDEATGYQKQKDEYQKILSEYIAKEIRPWVKTFDDNYYKQLYRLLGWDWDAFKSRKKNHSQYIGRLTNRIVYEKLPAGVLEALKKINPKDIKGNRKSKHHQRLSENIGYIHLIKYISAVTMLMEQFNQGEWRLALNAIDVRFPTENMPCQLSLDFPISQKSNFDKIIMKSSLPLQSTKGKKV
jgi:hypothetical protein